jgi:hypothetical protein
VAQSAVIAVAFAVFVSGCAAWSVTYEAHVRGQRMALVVQRSGRASLTGRLKADSVVINVAARLGLEKLVAFCASSVEGRPDHDVAVMDTGSLAKRDTRRHSRSTSPDRFRKPMITSAASGSTGRRGVSSASYARGALLALHLSQR